VAVPADRVAARPVAGRLRARVERHLDAVAGVEAGAAHLGEFPARAEIARAHFRVGLEAAGGEHDAFRLDVAGLAGVAHAQALHALIIGDEAERAGLVDEVDLVLARDLAPGGDQAGAAAPTLDREAAPEFELAVHFERLPTVDRRKLDALAAHPAHRLSAFLDQQLGEIRV